MYVIVYGVYGSVSCEFTSADLIHFVCASFLWCVVIYLFVGFFFFNDTATTEIYTLSLHDALPICHRFQKIWKRKIFYHPAVWHVFLAQKWPALIMFTYPLC